MSAERLKTRGPDNLASAARQWPTPAARDFRSPNKPDGLSRLSRPPTSGEQLPNAVGGALNPDWVELMMGYPVGHTLNRGSEASREPSSPDAETTDDLD
jgi:hypothetical protein